MYRKIATRDEIDFDQNHNQQLTTHLPGNLISVVGYHVGAIVFTDVSSEVQDTANLMNAAHISEEISSSG